MSYFNRLTEIVSCNLSGLLAQADDPGKALSQIIAEMEEGLSGARRSVSTAQASVDRLTVEMDQQKAWSQGWSDKAREHLVGHREVDARQCLIRKREVEDVLAGLQQQFNAAVATHERLTTVQRALEGRLAEARRKQLEMESSSNMPTPQAASAFGSIVQTLSDDHRLSQVDAELEALRREVGM